MKKRIFSLILCALLLSGCFTGCSESADSNISDESSSAVTDQAAETPLSQDAESETKTETELTPNLPANTNMDGKTFNILTAGFYSWEPLGIWDISAEELNGEGLNDAAFNRNEHMKATYNCDINEIPTGHCDEALASLQTAVTAGINDYDIALIRSWNYASAITGSLLTELKELTHCNYDMPWWDTSIRDQLAVAGKQFVINGGFTISDELAKNCMYFHKGLVEEFQLDNPYELVHSGSWTFDKMMSMTEGVNADLDSDGEWTTKDRYGIIHVDDTPGLLINAFNSRYVTKDSEGNLSLTIAEEETVTKIMHMIEAFSDRTVVFNVSHRSDNINVDEMGMFMANQALFSMAGIWYCPTYRSMEKDFGILPFPKYDEAQQDYLSPSSAIANTLLCVPQTNADYENTSIFMEDYSYQGYKNLVPAFYDSLLQGKVARDEDSCDMLDLIFANQILDVGIICEFGGYPALINSKTASYDSNIASNIASSKKVAVKLIEKMVATLQEG